jgi:hypothetical protein
MVDIGGYLPGRPDEEARHDQHQQNAESDTEHGYHEPRLLEQQIFDRDHR